MNQLLRKNRSIIVQKKWNFAQLLLQLNVLCWPIKCLQTHIHDTLQRERCISTVYRVVAATNACTSVAQTGLPGLYFMSHRYLKHASTNAASCRFLMQGRFLIQTPANDIFFALCLKTSLWGRPLMKVWLTAGVPVDSKGVGRAWGQVSVHTSTPNWENHFCICSLYFILWTFVHSLVNILHISAQNCPAPVHMFYNVHFLFTLHHFQYLLFIFLYNFYLYVCYAPNYWGIFLVCEDLLGNKPDFDSDSYGSVFVHRDWSRWHRKLSSPKLLPQIWKLS